MKKTILLAALAAVPVIASATATGTPCTGGNSGSVAVTAVTDGTEFIRRSFNAQCSSNVLLGYSQNQVALAVASGSFKGKSYFQGTTEGGGVTKVPGAAGDCPNTGCSKTTGDYTTKATAKLGSS